MDHRLNSGTLVLAGTPIGNFRDASTALAEALAKADLIAAEDTRKLRELLTRLQVDTHARVISHFEGNEASRVSELQAAVQTGQLVVVVSDAGMPTISDPGYRVVGAAISAGLPVRVLPGPSAVLVALALSGLPTDRFCFEGFLSRKAGERRRQLEALATEPRTMVFFEAPHRLGEFLAAASEVFGGERSAAVSRELTKTHEETRRGTLAELSRWAASPVRGEITVVIAGAPPQQVSVNEALALVEERIRAGASFSAAVAEVAQDVGLARKVLYQAALAARKERDG